MRLWPAGPDGCGQQVQMAKASALDHCQLSSCWIIVRGLQETSWPVTPHTPWRWRRVSSLPLCFSSLRTLSTRSHSAFTLALAQRFGHSSLLFSSYDRVISFRLQSLQPSYVWQSLRSHSAFLLRSHSAFLLRSHSAMSFLRSHSACALLRSPALLGASGWREDGEAELACRALTR